MVDERDREPALLREATSQLDEWFAGQRQLIDVQLDLAGSRFRRAVWSALRAIPYGTTTTYGQLARCLGVESSPGGPSAAQKVGWAVGATPTPIVVPCHRVLGADGSLTGYRGGLQRKQSLLEFEASGGRVTQGWQPRQLALL